jgi:hypothetical protein
MSMRRFVGTVCAAEALCRQAGWDYLRVSQLLFLLFIALSGRSRAMASELGKAVFLRGSEIWTVNADGFHLTQLTRDSVPKQTPVWSPKGDRIAYSLPFGPVEKPEAFIVIVSASGVTLKTLPIPRQGNVEFPEINAIDRLDWIDDDTIGIEGHINPSLGEYRILKARSGEVKRSFLGNGFTWSPVTKRLGQLCWQPHGIPDALRSDCVQVDGTTVYPSGDGRCLAFVDEIEGAGTTLVVLTDSARRVLQRELASTMTARSVGWVDAKTLVTVDGTGKWMAFRLQGESIDAIQEGVEAGWSAANDSRIKEREGREKVITELGGRDAKWWVPK